MKGANNIDKKIVGATKWATLTELMAKLIVPITNMILARLLVPEEFGVIATITMIISFADMFTDSGFQKYIVQHEFKSKENQYKVINVAFWTNLFLSLVLISVINIFAEKIALLFGDKNLVMVIKISSIQLLITSFYSIQMAIYRRNFDYKSLLVGRFIMIISQIVISIPLAIYGCSYWSIIIANMCGMLGSSIFLTIKSEWKPKMEYSFKILRKILSFTIWTLIETVTIWISAWCDIFMIGTIISSYDLGIYKTSINTVNSILGVIVGISGPILFGTLSRLQKNPKKFDEVFFQAQKMIGYIVIPMGVGIFLYRDVVTEILLGGSWDDAINYIGIYAIVSAVKIVLGDQYSEYYRAKGNPKISVIVQIIFIIGYIGGGIFLLKSKYLILYFIVGRMIIVVVHILIVKIVYKVRLIKTLNRIRNPILFSSIMGFFIIFIRKETDAIIISLVQIIIAIMIYIYLIYKWDKNIYKTFLAFLGKGNSD